MQLFVGKGGTGKSTMAAATAVAAARAGRRVLLASIDRAHSLTSVIGAAASPVGEPAAVRSVADNLDMVEIDSLGVLESRYRSLAALATAAGAHRHDSGLAMLDPEELTSVPGVQDLAGLDTVRDLVGSGRWDDIVVDCPATADWLAMATVPSLVGDYLERIWPRHSRVTAGVGGDPRLAVVVSLLERMDSGAAEVAAMLTDPGTTATVVTTANAVVLAETRELLAANSILGITTSSVVVNMLVPQFGSAPTTVLGTHPSVFWFEAMRSDQEQQLDILVRELPTLRVVRVRSALHEPVGLTSLDAIADDLVDERNASGNDPFPRVEPQVRHESGAGLDSVYVMTVELPLVDPDTVSVGRVEDDVIVSAGRVRRRFRLASVLRRCDVVGAELDDATLTVRFVPDPSVWPT
ncbi:membrane protein [Rhodococcoides trifolii]|uniref:Membrane protein n=1 Tax=Rhodococcoides trifolii TaxID=908250 RepID=A0A917D290_9NOCA|nr:ArsA family ATPase [Rhodococcus trifolii]GGG05280.1 membrane protein [Rhodococcus trifolii]